MTTTKNNVVPKALQEDINRAVKILKQGGCSEIFLFGSSVSGKMRDGSDIDIAVRGCPHGSFFRVLGRLMLELDHPVDLVDLDAQDLFAQFLKKHGRLIRVD